MISPAAFRALALGFPGAEQGSHFDVVDFRAGGRIFATWRDKDARAMVKLAPDQQQLLLEAQAGSFEPIPGAWGEQGATRVHLDRVDEASLRHAMVLAWQLATAKVSGRKGR